MIHSNEQEKKKQIVAAERKKSFQKFFYDHWRTGLQVAIIVTLLLTLFAFVKLGIWAVQNSPKREREAWERYARDQQRGAAAAAESGN